MADFSLRDRDSNWQQLASNSQQWDLIIVGGGITGAGVLRAAASHGLRVLLVEQTDFAWGTSSRSSKMVHGGLRYLAMGDFSLTKHSLLERERMLNEAPGLVARMGYYFTLNKKKSPPSFAVKALLWLYDRIAGIKDHYTVSLEKLQGSFTGIDTESLKGAFYYTDAVTDDSRLVQRVIQEAINDGGVAINYSRVSSLIKNTAGEVEGVNIENTLASGPNSVLSLKAKFVVNATGAWADRLRNEVNDEKRIRPLRGSHIVLAPGVLQVSDALTLMHPVDNRAVFVFPWENRTVIGTTDLDHSEDMDIEASISAAEVDYLLATAKSIFPNTKLVRASIISSWAGVRPVIGSEKNKDPSKERRNHAVWVDGRLITVSGGKLTTFRLIAQDVLNAADLANSTASNARVFAQTTLSAEQLKPCPAELAKVLIGRYGDQAQKVVAQAKPEELAFIADTRFSLADCRWALGNESVQHLDDLLLRRTRLGLLLAQGGEEIMAPLKALCQQLLHWSDTNWEAELVRYQGIWQAHYFIPPTDAAVSPPAASSPPVSSPAVSSPVVKTDTGE